MNDSPTPRIHPRLAEWPRDLHLRWCGPDDVADRLHLQPCHPGFLVAGDEEGVLLNWTDTSRILQFHGHLEADWLEVVSEQEHQQASEQLRASAWSGFPLDDEAFMAAWHAEPHLHHRLDHLPICSYVRWCGPDEVARRLHLQPGHPGLLVAADGAHAVIDWADVPEVLQYNGRFNPDWLQLITEQEHQQASERLRASGWAGFPWQDEQAMATWGEDPWITGGEASPAGTRVRFASEQVSGDRSIRDSLGLQPDHPGTVISSGEKHAIVHWVDATGVYEHEGVMAPEWLDAIDEEDYQRRAQLLRGSGWRGVYRHVAPGFE
ncbi:hypothetical protein FHR75_004119 [Kineococcus radiotolerans]|uniref:Uncharacterized protein n=1 Tax=Kineococcus radiotolerans TaxID=131568 RepID=A0A7W4TQN1_KINRA|nr:hypothetical protein [Kineococcus radiotolerans]MBB2903277.1 hypothetical protein [Kineococcus radiotolerans]